MEGGAGCARWHGYGRWRKGRAVERFRMSLPRLGSTLGEHAGFGLVVFQEVCAILDSASGGSDVSRS